MGEKQNRKSWLTVISEIMTIISILGLVFAYCDYRAQKSSQIENKREMALLAFKEADFRNAYNLFKELQNVKPKDTTGYNAFLQKSKEFDDMEEAMDFLKVARSLHPNPSKNEANDIIERNKQ